MALFRDAKGVGAARADAACLRALRIGSPTRKSVVAILQAGLDKVALEPEPQDVPAVEHENVRGGEYYDTSVGHDGHAEQERPT